jgi:hypothetical protein
MCLKTQASTFTEKLQHTWSTELGLGINKYANICMNMCIGLG